MHSTNDAPNYAEWTDDDLIRAYHNMNRAKFPEHFVIVQQELQKRGITPLETPNSLPHSSQALHLPEFPGVLQRGFAFFIDILILFLIDLAFYPFSSLIQKFDEWTPLLEILIVILYFTQDRTGQTPGKKITRIKMIQTNGNPLSFASLIPRSLIVYSPNSLPFSLLPSTLSTALFGVMILLALGQALIFIHPQKRSLLDLLANSVLVREDVTTPTKIDGFPLWSWLNQRTTLIGLLTFTVLIWRFTGQPQESLSPLAPTQTAQIEEALAKQVPYRISDVHYMKEYNSNGQEQTHLIVQMHLPYDDFQNSKKVDDIGVKIDGILSTAMGHPTVDVYQVKLTSTKYIGLFRSETSRVFQKTADRP